jgi:mono/diheme cytochrome c family protein
MQHAERRAIVTILAAVLGLTLSDGLRLQAHKPVTSPYTYNEHVYPIFRDHCGQCHVEGGVAPMSLLTYRDPASGGAFAWAQSIRESLVAEAMPPWYADPTGPLVAGTRTLSSRELDTIVTWASGGAPEGDPARTPAPAAAQPQWANGTPDLVIPMPAAHVVAAATLQETFEVVLPTSLTRARWVKAADLLPGTPTMVRRARISVVDGPVLALWEPGDDGAAAPDGMAFRLPAGAKLRLDIFYKKPWQEEQVVKSDRSSVGLYFAESRQPPSAIEQVTISASKPHDRDSVSFTGKIGMTGRVVAVHPQLDAVYSTMEITAVTPTGQRRPLLKLHAARPEWPRRYWLQQPVDLPSGTTIEVTATHADDGSGLAAKAMDWPLEISLDIARR